MLNQVTSEIETLLRTALPQTHFSDADPRYLEEPRGRYRAPSGLVAKPQSTDEVAALVKIASAHGIPIIPYGGGTGLVGGQIAQEHRRPIILSLEKMTKLRSEHPQERSLTIEAGATLSDVQSRAAELDLLFPLSLASEGSAQIGGVMSTNAGGTAVLRYGNARDLCLGLEAVMADGSVYNGLKRLRKDNSGYDLRHLLLGSEGTLGIITAASLRLFSRPEMHGTALLAVESPEAALDLLAFAQSHFGEMISSFELIHRQGFDFIDQTMPQLRNPWSDYPDWTVLFEVGLPKCAATDQALDNFLESGMNAELIQDGHVAQSETQRRDFWALRESIPEANRHIGSVSSHDISLPLSQISDFIKTAPAAIAEVDEFRINCFGHLGDGNLHYNVFPTHGKSRADHHHQRDTIKRVIHDLVHARGGSVSAEHGIGRLKVDDLERYQDPIKMSAMRAIKTALDPKGILNPGALFRYEG